jgi:hypothetical protein
MSLRFIPYVMLNGTAQEAIRFYEKSLGAIVVFKETFAKSPDPTPEDAKDRVAHSALLVCHDLDEHFQRLRRKVIIKHLKLEVVLIA